MAKGIVRVARAWLLVGAVVAGSMQARAAQAHCLGDTDAAAALAATRDAGFVIDDPARRATTAIGLLDCLGDPDPAIRDGLAYEALAAWLRAAALDEATRRQMLDRLSAMLDAPDDDSDGLRPPFAALVLSEVARSDRVAPWMTDAERVALLDRATRYVATLRDYRGFDPVQGWRHGVAHGADLLMQLALNPALDLPQLERIVTAVAAQLPPADGTSYIFGEPQRLARPVLFAAQRGLFDEAAWTAWCAARVAAIGDDPALAYRDRAWLARRHAVVNVLQALYVETDASDDPRLAPLRAGVLAALKTLP